MEVSIHIYPESNVIILLTTEHVRIIINSGATTTLLNHDFSSVFSDFCLNSSHTTQKSNNKELWGCQHANSESNMIILLATELVRIIVNSGATTT